VPLHRALASLSVITLAYAVPARSQAAAPAAAALLGPADSLIPSGPLGAAIRRGRALLLATRDSLPAHVGNSLRCASCHLDAGRRASGSWVGVYTRYPQYRSRSNSVETIEYRVNDCFRRSMNGRPIAVDGPEMRDIVAYFAFLSRDVPASSAAPRRASAWAGRTADTAAGRGVYGAACARCHGADGDGAAGPPLWGPRSYNIGAGMARVLTAAAFVKENMPFDAPGSLSDKDALDVAGFVNAHPRPDFPDKAGDWPNGDAPPDAPYQTAHPAQGASRH